MAAYDICVFSLRFVLFAFVTWKIKSLGVGLSPGEGVSSFFFFFRIKLSAFTNVRIS